MIALNAVSKHYGRQAVLAEADAEVCALQSLKLSGPGLSVQVTRDGASAFVHVCADCEGHAHEEILPADVVSEAELISEQLSRAGGGTHYATVLPLMEDLLAR